MSNAFAKATLGLVLLLLSSILAAAQQLQYFTPIPTSSQIARGAAGANDGAIGMAANKSSDGFVVATVVPGSPAEKAAIKPGDVIKKLNGKAAVDLSQMDYFAELKKKPGEVVEIVFVRAGQESTVKVMAEPRSTLYPQEGKMPPAVSQFILEGHASVSAVLSQDNPQRVFLWLQFYNNDVPMLSLDEVKFFVLDGQRQQLHRVTLDEIHYSIQMAVAQNMRSGPVPPPPPSQRQYRITGTENGNYTLQDMGGGTTTATSTSSSTYTVSPQPDYNELGYSLGAAIRQWRDRKHDQEVVQEAQQTVNQWDAAYLKTQTPMIQGENRTGAITFWSAQGAKGPFKVVLFVTDPTTKEDQPVTFEFR